MARRHLVVERILTIAYAIERSSSMDINLSKLQDGARLRLSVIGVPKYVINPLVDQVFKWVACNGPEWSIRRLKNLKVDLIRKQGGLPLQSTWIRKNQSGYYYGVIGSLFRWCENHGNPRRAEKRFEKVIQALNIYTLMSSRSVTKSQFKKFIDGVNCKADTKLDVNWHLSFSDSVYAAIGQRKIERGGNSLLEFRGSHNKWAPRPHGMRRVRQDSHILEEILWYEGTANTQHAWDYYELYAPVTSCIAGPLRVEKYKTLKPDEFPYGGEVHFLQEPGFKLRAIASPYRIHQLALKPLGDAIYSIVKSLEWDCTFDQSKAFPRIQSALRSGVKVHSIDLSGATDYFPLEIITTALRRIFGDVKDISLFEDVSRMRWKSQLGDIQWERGQPLGLYPSFGAFTLTHGLLLYYLNGNSGDKFFVLGDDVLIMDDQLYERYIKLLDMMSCPWSLDKSLSSSSLCEFAGKIITQNSIIPQYKWRKMSNDNFLTICALLGPRSRVLLSHRQQKVFDSVKNLLPPLGLNMSYPGSNLYTMIKRTEELLSVIDAKVVKSLTDLTNLIDKKTYQSDVPYVLNDEIIKSIRSTFDEKVDSVYKQTVVYRLKTLWSAYADIPRALDLLPRLPTAVYLPSRVSTLERYEGLLQNIK